MSKTIFAYQNVLRAYYACRRNKRRSLTALGYELDFETRLMDLALRLQKRTYRPDRLVCFVVTKPKVREIFASEFADRITHHLLINEVEQIWEQQIFIKESYACRKGKGNHYAARRAQFFASQFAYYGQFDIKHFFSSINKSILFEIFKGVIQQQPRSATWKEEVLWLAEQIIFHDPTHNAFHKGNPHLRRLLPQQKSLFEAADDVGMPIGNLSSQFLANVYMHELDAYATTELKLPAYARYVDDFLLFANDQREIITARNALATFLKQRLALTLHPRKQQIQPTRHGIPFVGYFIRPTGIQVRRNVVKNLKQRLFHFRHRRQAAELLPVLNSYYGHLRQARSTRLRRHLFKAHLHPRLRPSMWIVGDYKSFKLVKSLKQSA